MKNIILITVDALRYDHSKIVKNKVSEILGKGIDFENAYSTGPSTSMSYIGFLCSKFPTFPDEINTIAKLGVNRKRTLLYEILKNSGFSTYVISNCLFNRFYGYDKGIDLMIDKNSKITLKRLKKIISHIKGENDLPYFDAQEITEIVKKILKEQISEHKVLKVIGSICTDPSIPTPSFPSRTGTASWCRSPPPSSPRSQRPSRTSSSLHSTSQG